MAKKDSISLESNGKPVFFYYAESQFFIYNESTNKMDEVEEAVIVNKPLSKFPLQLLISWLKEKNLPEDISLQVYPSVGFELNHSYHHFLSDDSRTWCYINTSGFSIKIDELTYKKIQEVSQDANKFTDLCGNNSYNGKYMESITALRIVGIGKTVTPQLFKLCCAKGESSPRYWLEDPVAWDDKAGFIKAFKKDNVSVLLQDGSKTNVSYEKLKKNTKIQKATVELPETIQENFKKSLENANLYRSEIKVMKVDSPYLSGEHIHETKCANCPNCTIFLAKEIYWWGSNDNSYTCVNCRQQAYLISEDDGIGTFVLADKPAKNKFCIEEARCCNNCANFEFASGRQGKRSTGYCQFSNLCVVAHNVCKKWIPDEPKKYEGTIKQHITNLGTGVAKTGSHRYVNEKRIEGEIEDLIYQESDHQEQKKVADALKGAYNVGWMLFRKKLLEKAKDLPVNRF